MYLVVSRNVGREGKMLKRNIRGKLLLNKDNIFLTLFSPYIYIIRVSASQPGYKQQKPTDTCDV